MIQAHSTRTSITQPFNNTVQYQLDESTIRYITWTSHQLLSTHSQSSYQSWSN